MTSPIELEMIPCPLCGSVKAVGYVRAYDGLYGIPGEFQIVRCLDCDHRYMNPRPTHDSILHCYPVNYGPHHVEVKDEVNGHGENSVAATERSAPSAWYLSSFVRAIPGLRSLYYWLSKDNSNLIPTDLGAESRAIELGCATGEFLEKLRAAGCTVEGVELVKAAAEQARSRGFCVHTGTLDSVPLKENHFDAAFAWMVIEHLPQPKETLISLCRILRRDGYLVFSVPNAGCWEPWVFGKYWSGFDLPRHLQHFTPRRLNFLLQECGFDRITVQHQRNLLNVVSSVGILLTRWFPRSSFAARVLAWHHRPTLWWQLGLAPTAMILAWLRQGGRITVVARKRNSSSDDVTSSEDPTDKRRDIAL